jgi:CRP-like cAMP-binding protein
MEPGNLLLAALPRGASDRLRRHMTTVDLPHGEILHRPNQPIKVVYFPLDCLISVVITMREGRTTEAGAVGSREMVGLNAFMGGRETNQTQYVCKVAGRAVRLAAKPLRDEFNRVEAVRDVMLRFTQAYIGHLSQNVACNRLHELEQRVPRWLLECRDRLRTDDLPITHEFIAQLLGATRPGVTQIVGALRERGVIAHTRSKVRVVDRAGLERVSCECYRVTLDEYDRLLKPLIRSAR